MATEVFLAVAGSGKTAEIVERIAAQQPGTESLAVTYTLNAQAEIESRLSSINATAHETTGWFSFLLRHIIRPYLPRVFPAIVPRGLSFVQSEADIPRARSGWKYYFDDEHRPFSTRLSVLAKKVLVDTDGAPIRRLEDIYRYVYLDEFQDLRGNDLEVLRALMQSKIDVLLAGDVRQAVLATSRSDRLNSTYRGVDLVNWFRKQAADGLCTITYRTETTRFNQTIADLSDRIHDPALALPPTRSCMNDRTEHDGVWLVDETHAVSYASSIETRPTILWSRSSKRSVPEGELLTFGKAKGLTRDRVMIYKTDPIIDLLKSRKPLKDRSAAGFYVAVTRARFSVAIVTPNAAAVHANLHTDFRDIVSLWSP